jgi:hypothetical protein
MNTIQRIAKNTGVLLVSQIASYIIGFFFIMYQTLRKFDQNASQQTFEKSLIGNVSTAFRISVSEKNCEDMTRSGEFNAKF